MRFFVCFLKLACNYVIFVFSLRTQEYRESFVSFETHLHWILVVCIWVGGYILSLNIERDMPCGNAEKKLHLDIALRKRRSWQAKGEAGLILTNGLFTVMGLLVTTTDSRHYPKRMDCLFYFKKVEWKECFKSKYIHRKSPAHIFTSTFFFFKIMSNLLQKNQ